MPGPVRRLYSQDVSIHARAVRRARRHRHKSALRHLNSTDEREPVSNKSNGFGLNVKNQKFHARGAYLGEARTLRVLEERSGFALIIIGRAVRRNQSL